MDPTEVLHLLKQHVIHSRHNDGYIGMTLSLIGIGESYKRGWYPVAITNIVARSHGPVVHVAIAGHQLRSVSILKLILGFGVPDNEGTRI
jgi:hypothetical protein